MQLEKNEVNNLIYILLKYTFGRSKIIIDLESPPNSLIKEVLLNIEYYTVNEIINKTYKIIYDKYSLISNYKEDDIKEYMFILADIFFKTPYKVRIDLGIDTDAEEFITKH